MNASATSSSGLSRLADRTLDRYSQLLAQFREALLRNEEPRIEDYLRKITAAHRPRLFAGLLELELAFKSKDYRQRFPRQFEAIVREYRGVAETLSLQASRSAKTSLDPNPKLPKHLEIVRPLGRGTYGIVYLVADTILNICQAVKVLKRRWIMNPYVRDMLKQEAATIATQQHPGVVGVRYWLDLEDGGGAIVMEYVEGITLQRFSKSLGDDPHRIDRLLRVMHEVARIIGYVHSGSDGKAALVHRDLKPTNILVDKYGKPHIVDLGFAALTSRLALGREDACGTWAYMSPEQVRSFARTDVAVDPRSDIWSLGVIIYEILTGELPFGTSCCQRQACFR